MGRPTGPTPVRFAAVCSKRPTCAVATCLIIVLKPTSSPSSPLQSLFLCPRLHCPLYLPLHCLQGKKPWMRKVGKWRMLLRHKRETNLLATNRMKWNCLTAVVWLDVACPLSKNICSRNTNVGNMLLVTSTSVARQTAISSSTTSHNSANTECSIELSVSSVANASKLGMTCSATW